MNARTSGRFGFFSRAVSATVSVIAPAADALSIYFKDSTNSTNYQFSTSIDYYNSLVNAISNRSCDANSDLLSNQLSASYVPIENWQGAVLSRGAGELGNITMETCLRFLINATDSAYQAMRNAANTEKADHDKLGELIVSIFGGTIGSLFGLSLLFGLGIYIRNQVRNYQENKKITCNCGPGI